MAALNTGAPARVLACVTEGFRGEHASVLGQPVTGRAAYAERLPGFFASLPGLRYDVGQPLVDGQRVALPYWMSATDAASGRPVRLRGLLLVEVSAGQVDHRVDYWDGADYQRQVGGAA